ncbi:MAG: ribonuclease P protein component [Bacteroidia bacterium]|nr:MAG: ribonuclease P protein component [Bacteroidia bacterium]
MVMHTFRKNERLGNYRLNSILFSKGKHFFQYPFRVTYFCMPEDSSRKIFSGREIPPGVIFQYPAKCVIGVSKHHVKKATKRNHIKRMVKEAYRKNKSTLYTFLQDRHANCLLALIYVSGKALPFREIEKKVKGVLGKLTEEINEGGLQELPAGTNED